VTQTAWFNDGVNEYENGCFSFPSIATVPMTPFTRLHSDWPKPWIRTNHDTAERRCYVCEEWVPLDSFHRSSDPGDGGYQYACKSCCAETSRAKRARRNAA